MGKTVAAVIGLSITALVFLWWAFCIGMSIYGMYLAFSASIILGLCCFIVAPIFTVSGLLQVFFHFNLPEQILIFIQNHVH